MLDNTPRDEHEGGSMHPGCWTPVPPGQGYAGVCWAVEDAEFGDGNNPVPVFQAVDLFPRVSCGRKMLHSLQPGRVAAWGGEAVGYTTQSCERGVSTARSSSGCSRMEIWAAGAPGCL